MPHFIARLDHDPTSDLHAVFDALGRIAWVEGQKDKAATFTSLILAHDAILGAMESAFDRAVEHYGTPDFPTWIGHCTSGTPEKGLRFSRDAAADIVRIEEIFDPWDLGVPFKACYAHSDLGWLGRAHPGSPRRNCWTHDFSCATAYPSERAAVDGYEQAEPAPGIVVLFLNAAFEPLA